MYLIDFVSQTMHKFIYFMSSNTSEIGTNVCSQCHCLKWFLYVLIHKNNFNLIWQMIKNIQWNIKYCTDENCDIASLIWLLFLLFFFFGLIGFSLKSHSFQTDGNFFFALSQFFIKFSFEMQRTSLVNLWNQIDSIRLTELQPRIESVSRICAIDRNDWNQIHCSGNLMKTQHEKGFSPLKFNYFRQFDFVLQINQIKIKWLNWNWT